MTYFVNVTNAWSGVLFGLFVTVRAITAIAWASVSRYLGSDNFCTHSASCTSHICTQHASLLNFFSDTETSSRSNSHSHRHCLWLLPITQHHSHLKSASISLAQDGCRPLPPHIRPEGLGQWVLRERCSALH